MVHAVGDRIADEQVVAVLGRKLIGGVADDAGDAGRAVRVLHDLRAEAEAVVWLAEARVVRAAKEHVRGLRVAVGREQVAERIEGEAERIHLAVREELDVRAVGAEAVDVAAFELDFLAVGAAARGCCWRSRGRRRSSRRWRRERVVEAVRIAMVEGAEQDFAFFGEAVAVGVGKTCRSLGMLKTTASRVLSGVTPMGMLRSSAKVVILVAEPSALKPSMMRSVRRGPSRLRLAGRGIRPSR